MVVVGMAATFDAMGLWVRCDQVMVIPPSTRGFVWLRTRRHRHRHRHRRHPTAPHENRHPPHVRIDLSGAGQNFADGSPDDDSQRPKDVQ
ncbi:hypothetical protein RHA1_ro02690 [Rhodococcus jostii RHA1]|uniref:Uncharacterized protein n=1 Tax=Rhodococcus jostii (strain RHA1) TaxID=101510 RepID=Q0SD91_RHOJR|nr:hypothetical protein RHA1_ro02690 [Rhodococcus jostii RHA1]